MSQALPHRRPVVPPAKPSGTPARPGPQPPTRLDEWVAASLRNGALYRDVLREGRRLFGVSESTVKRSISRARKGQQ